MVGTTNGTGKSCTFSLESERLGVGIVDTVLGIDRVGKVLL